jgi:hypothetical protein
MTEPTAFWCQLRQAKKAHGHVQGPQRRRDRRVGYTDRPALNAMLTAVAGSGRGCMSSSTPDVLTGIVLIRVSEVWNRVANHGPPASTWEELSRQPVTTSKKKPISR